MNTMTYQGYTARVEFDERDNIFVGRVLGLRSIISFHGETVKQLRSEFKTAVDDYLKDCEEQGVSPAKPASGKLLLRVPPEIHSKALIKAQASGKSLNQWATEALERAVEARDEQRAEFVGAAMERRATYRANGRTVSFDDMEASAMASARGEQPHKPRATAKKTKKAA